MDRKRLARQVVLLAGALVVTGCATGDPGESDRPAQCEATRAQNETLAERGDREAAFQMAELYDFGCGVPHRPGYAYLNYRVAAERGHVRAAMRLADFYMGSSVVSTDWAQGLFWMAVAERSPTLTPRERGSIAYKQRNFLNSRFEGNGSEMLRQAEQRATAWTPRRD